MSGCDDRYAGGPLVVVDDGAAAGPALDYAWRQARSHGGAVAWGRLIRLPVPSDQG